MEKPALLRSFTRMIVEQRHFLVLVLIILSGFFAANLGSLTVIFNPATGLPQNHPYVMATNKAAKLFGSDNVMIVSVTATEGTAFKTDIFKKVQTITQKMKSLPDIMPATIISVTSPMARNITGDSGVLDVTPLMNRIPMSDAEMEELRKRINANPIYSGILLSDNESTLFISAGFKAGKAGFRRNAKLLEAILDAEKDESVKFGISGDVYFVALIEEFSLRMGPLFLLALLIIGLIHYEAFRTMQALILPLVSALLAVLWSVGIMAAFGVPLDPFNATTPILILAIAAGHAVQILKRYYEEFGRLIKNAPATDRRSASHAAIIETMDKVGPVMIAAGLVAAASFFSLLVFQLEAIRSFGIFTGLGILSTLVLELAFVPAIRALLPPPNLQETKSEAKITLWDRIATGLGEAVLVRRRAIFFTTCVGCCMLFFFAAQVRVDGSNESFFYGDVKALKDYNFLKEQFPGTHVLYGIFESGQPGEFKRPETLAAVKAVQSYASSLPEVGKTVSLVDFVERMNFAIHDNDPKFNSIPGDRDLISQYLFLYSSSGNPGDLGPYVDDDYQNIAMTMLLRSNPNSYVEEFIENVGAFAKDTLDPSIKFSIGGAGTSGAALSQVLVPEKMINIGQIMMMVFIVSSIIFRSLVAGLLITVPLAITVLANFGIMGLLNIPLQVATAVTSAMAVGIGADYAIYLFYRLREEFKEDRDEVEAVRRSFASSGKAILFVSSAVAGGYSVLMISYGFNIHLWLGLLISCGMVVSALCSLTIFPALITFVRPKAIYGPATPNPHQTSFRP
jgi:predicted RND superfamily exporter protein